NRSQEGGRRHSGRRPVTNDTHPSEERGHPVRGHIRKRGNTWSIVVEMGVDARGRRRQKWRGGFVTKRQAEQALAEFVHALNSGAFIEPSRLTVGEFLVQQWLPAIRSTVRPSTLLSYESYIRNYYVPYLGTAPLQKVSGAMLNA